MLVMVTLLLERERVLEMLTVMGELEPMVSASIRIEAPTVTPEDIIVLPSMARELELEMASSVPIALGSKTFQFKDPTVLELKMDMTLLEIDTVLPSDIVVGSGP